MHGTETLSRFMPPAVAGPALMHRMDNGAAAGV